jgi:alpha-tubulin suppressor-like RCC1 family protein
MEKIMKKICLPAEVLTKAGIVLLICVIGGSFCLGAKSCTGRNSKKTKTGSSNIPVFTINAPSNLSATAVSFSQIDLSWTDNSNNEDGFSIERSLDGITYTQLTTISTGTASYSDSGLDTGITYYYRVRAFMTTGDYSSYSNEVSATTFSLPPQGLPSAWLQVAASYYETFALATNGTVWSWGRNDYGQLGLNDSTYTDRFTPSLIESDNDWNVFENITAVVANQGQFSSALALKTDPAGGTLWGWGANGAGLLGLGDTNSPEVPTQVGLYNSDYILINADSDWAQVSAGSIHTIARKTNGTIWACGLNYEGELGLGDTINRTTPSQIQTDSDWSIVEGGGGHSLAIKTNRTLWAWGNNSKGRLGDGTTDFRTTPRQIGTSSDWAQTVAGGHSLGLKTSNTLWAWGDNGVGQLGDGTTTDRWTPRQIGTTSDWSMVTAGDYWTFGLKTNRTIWAWGYNTDGGLGLGDSGVGTNRTTPTQIDADSDWSAVATNGGQNKTHTVALKTDGVSIWVWGKNNYGQLGLGDTVDRKGPCPLGSPIPPSFLLVTTVSSSQIDMSWRDNSPNETGFIIERSPDGIIYATLVTVGSNPVSYSDTGLTLGTTYYYRIRAYNAFGDSPYSNARNAIPTLFSPLPLILTVVSSTQVNLSWIDNSPDETGFKIERKIGRNGTWIEIAIVNQGVIDYSYITASGLAPNTSYYYRVRAYIGTDDSNYSNTECVAISGNWYTVAAGDYHTIGLKTNGTIWAWGLNGQGQLGDPNIMNTTIPNRIGTDLDWSSIVACAYHNLGIKTNNTLWAWGLNNGAQLGDGTYDNRFTPRQIGTDSDWFRQGGITTGGIHSVGLKTNHTIWTWGNNSFSQLGRDGEPTTPGQVGTASDWSIASAGYVHTIALKTNGILWAWGWNEKGQLGDGTTTARGTPRQIGTDSDWSAIAGDKNAVLQGYTIALKTNGTIWTWGNNSSGQLGRGGETTTPGQVGTDYDWSLVATGGNNTFAFKTNGTLWCWGNNQYGQLGLGDAINRNVPTLVGE